MTDKIIFILNLITYFIPQRNEIVMHSFPDFDDSTRAIISKDWGMRINILTSSDTKPPQWAISPEVSIYRKWSIRGVYTYLRTKYIFFTHGLYGTKNTHRNKISINIWHGMPLKKIGYLDTIDNKNVVKSDYLLSSGPLFTPILKSAFRHDKVLEFGLPRNDFLTTGYPTAERCAVMLPTYRNTTNQNMRCDADMTPGFFGLDHKDLAHIDKLFQLNSITLYVKPHPMEINIPSIDYLSDFKKIKIIDDNYLLLHNTSLYELLGRSDFIITDYSSVIFDYWLTERPIFLFTPDIGIYRDKRGFTFDMDFSQIFGAFKSDNSKQLCESITSYFDGTLLWRNSWDSFGFNSNRHQATERLVNFVKNHR